MRLIAVLLLHAMFLCGAAQAMDEEPADSPPSSESTSSPSAKVVSSPELVRLVAPVALYPDSVLSILLSAATYPEEVAEAARWLRRNASRRGEAGVRAVMREPWDTSVRVLVGFPELLLQLDESRDWTRQLGRAFLAHESAMLDAVQSLRAKALAAGRLPSSAELRVERRGTQILIESPSGGALWLPWYDPATAFGVEWPKASPPIQWPAWPGYTRRSGVFAWGAPIPMSRGFVYAGFDWQGRMTHIASIRHYQGVPGMGSPPVERAATIETASIPETPAAKEPAVATPAAAAPMAPVATLPSRPVPLVGLSPQAAGVPPPAVPPTAMPQSMRTEVVDRPLPASRRVEPTPAPVASLVALGKPDAGRSFNPPASTPETPAIREAPIVRSELLSVPQAVSQPAPQPVPQAVPQPSAMPEAKKPVATPAPVAAPDPVIAPVPAISPVPVAQPTAVASAVESPVEVEPTANGSVPRARRRVFISDMDSRTLNMLGGSSASKVDRLHP